MAKMISKDHETIVTVTGSGDDDDTFSGQADDGEHRSDWLADEYDPIESAEGCECPFCLSR